MRLTSIVRFATMTLLLGACAGSTQTKGGALGSSAAPQRTSPGGVVVEEMAEEGAAPKGPRVPSELAAMLEPRTCSPTLLTPTHFREYKDGHGNKHRAFLISPGEELCLIGSDSNDPLADLELSLDPVPLDDAKERLISVELQTLSMGSVLVVKNHYREQLHFRGSMVLPHQLDLVSTSVCPVMPGRFSVEHWPDPLNSLMLTDFTLHDPDEKLGCE
jgi:hypothetical protein